MEPQNNLAPVVEKEPYFTPELVRHGTVEELTQASVTFALFIDVASFIP